MCEISRNLHVFSVFGPKSCNIVDKFYVGERSQEIFLQSSPKSLRAESTRAVTGRRCPHSGEGEDFLTGQPDFFYRNSCNSGKESRKIVPKVGN